MEGTVVSVPALPESCCDGQTSGFRQQRATAAHPTEGMEDKQAGSSQRSEVSSPVSRSVHVSKPAQAPKRLHGVTRLHVSHLEVSRREPGTARPPNVKHVPVPVGKAQLQPERCRKAGRRAQGVCTAVHPGTEGEPPTGARRGQ